MSAHVELPHSSKWVHFHLSSFSIFVITSKAVVDIIHLYHWGLAPVYVTLSNER